MQEFVLKDSKYRMRYHDFPGEDTPILFIHGLGCAGSFDYPQVATQKELSGYRRILIDLLGSGFSDKPNGFGYTVRDHAEYLLDFVNQLGLHQFAIFGHSLGGAVALSLADRCGDRISNIILSEANLDRSGSGSTSLAIGTYTEEKFLSDGFQEILWQNQNVSNEMWAASFSVTSPVALYRISRSAIEGQTPSSRDILYSLKCPKTFIFGENSLPDPEMQVLSDHGLHIEIVRSAGHSMAWENPRGLATAIKNGMVSR